MGYLFALGFVSILSQVVLLRELSVASYGIELAYTIALGIWLLSTAGGTLLKIRRQLSPPIFLIPLFFLLFSIILPLDIAFIRSSRLLFSNLPGAFLPFHLQIFSIAASVLPIALILGILFRWTACACIQNGRSLAAAYAIESIGGLAGGLCATGLIQFGFQNLVIGLICALVSAGASFLDFDGRTIGKFRAFSIVIISLLMALVWKAPSLDREMTAWTHPNLVKTQDSPYSRITISFLEGQVSVFENDSLLFDTESSRAEEFVHLAALQHPNPKRVLILGGGLEGTVHQVLGHSPRIVDYVELNPDLLQAVPPNLPLSIQKSLRADNVRVTIADPRRFLEKALTYDLILVGMPEPDSGQANRFYTRELFKQCRAKLDANGILAFRLQSSENLWSPLLTRRMVGIYQAALSAFPEVLFIPGTTNIVLSAASPLTKDPQILAERLAERKLETGIISEPYLRYLYTNARFQQIAGILASGSAPTNTDVRPICYQYTAMIWLSKLLPSAQYWHFEIPKIGSGQSVLWIAALSVAVFLLTCMRWPMRRILLMGIAGCAGMILETVLLLYFQTKNGILYQDIGLLLTGFMAGMALGAFGVDKISRNPSRFFGGSLFAGFALLSGAIGWRIASASSATLAECFAYLVLTGILVSAIFAFGGTHGKEDQSKAVTPLYAADLIGGCLGSLLASLYLVPMAGMANASYLMMPLLLLSALLV